MKTKLFIDFDNTLFDTRPFKKSLFNIFRSLGFSENEIINSYKKANQKFAYSPIGQIEILRKIKDFNVKEVLLKVDSLYKNAPKLLFSDTLSFLQSLDREKFEVNLLTLGDIKFQKEKVVSSGIASFFDNLYYCQEEKWKYLKKIVKKDEKFIIIDDRSDALCEISKKYLNSITIEINRTKEPIDIMEKPSLYQGIKVDNFKKVFNYL